MRIDPKMQLVCDSGESPLSGDIVQLVLEQLRACANEARRVNMTVQSIVSQLRNTGMGQVADAVAQCAANGAAVTESVLTALHAAYHGPQNALQARIAEERESDRAAGVDEVKSTGTVEAFADPVEDPDAPEPDPLRVIDDINSGGVAGVKSPAPRQPAKGPRTSGRRSGRSH